MGQFTIILFGFFMLLWASQRTGFAKECTNIPTQSSHSLRALELKGNSSFGIELKEGKNFRVSFPLKHSVEKTLLESSEVRLEMPRRLQNVVLRDVPLVRIRLNPASDEGKAQETNLQYLLSLDVDRLVWSFRTTAGLRAPKTPYGGWEDPRMELRGHFVGHYLSATALMWASTFNESVKLKMSKVVDALGECQEELGTGYLSAFPSTFFDRFEAIEPVWAPYYTIHKIMAGLLDQYTIADNLKALDMLLWMTKYFLARVESVIRTYTIERHYTSLNEEVGGINDVMYRLYMLTEDPEHLKLAHYFDKPCFLGPLALETDGLSGFHANTHIPLVVGAQMRYESTDDRLYKDLSQYFIDLVDTSHRYATGGTSADEFWADPNRQADHLTTEAQESCTTYNMLKVARNLYRWGYTRYADYYERALVNGVLGIQRGQEPGVMIYMLPQRPGASKAKSYHGWGTPFDSMWCCYGTGIESFSKLGDSIYFEDESDELFVMRFSSSTLLWLTLGVALEQNVQPLSSYCPNLTVTFEVKPLPQTSSGRRQSLSVRIPSWTKPGGRILLNRRTSTYKPRPGGYVTFSEAWTVGDKLEIEVPISLAIERIQDDRQKYSTLHSILFGPYLLAGMTAGANELGAVNTSWLSSWLVPVSASYNDQLYSFSQNWAVDRAAATGHQIPYVISEGRGFAEMRSAPEEGTDEAAYATFRLVESPSGPHDSLIHQVQPSEESSTAHRPLQDITHIGHLHLSDSVTPIKFSVVTLEPYSKPGVVLAHTGPNSKIVVVDRMETSEDESPHMGQINAEFRLTPGLSGDGNSVSFEAASHPGCFLATNMDSSITLRCKTLGPNITDHNFQSTCSFNVKKGLASYHRISFIARGEKNKFLLFPISAYKDESYTTYFNITNSEENIETSSETL